MQHGPAHFLACRCCICFHDEKNVALLGAPCIAFSKHLDLSVYRKVLQSTKGTAQQVKWTQPRMGKRAGFANEATKELHDIGTRVMKEVGLSIHENVVQFSEDVLAFIVQRLCAEFAWFLGSCCL